VEQKEAAVAKQRCGKQISAATNKDATIEELLEAVFSMRFVLRLYVEDQRENSSEVGVGN
jgi:hypothetical protein